MYEPPHWTKPPQVKLAKREEPADAPAKPHTTPSIEDLAETIKTLKDGMRAMAEQVAGLTARVDDLAHPLIVGVDLGCEAGDAGYCPGCGQFGPNLPEPLRFIVDARGRCWSHSHTTGWSCDGDAKPRGPLQSDLTPGGLSNYFLSKMEEDAASGRIRTMEEAYQEDVASGRVRTWAAVRDEAAAPCTVNVGYINDKREHALISVGAPVMANADPDFAQVVLTIDAATRLSHQLKAFLAAHAGKD